MTTTLDRPGAPAATRPSRTGVTWPRILWSEWTKLWSLRSTWYTLALSVVLGVGLAAAIAAGMSDGEWGDGQPFDAVATVLTGTGLAGLGLGVLGALQVSGEYATGTVATTFAAVPSRWPVLVAKIVVLTAVVLPVGLATSAGGVLAADLVLDDASGVSLGADGALRAVAGSGAYLAALALLGLAVAALVRVTALAVTLLVAVVFVLPTILPLVPGELVATVADHMPSVAGESLSTTLPGMASLSLPVAVATLAGWVLLPLAAGVVRLLRADV